MFGIFIVSAVVALTLLLVFNVTDYLKTGKTEAGWKDVIALIVISFLPFINTLVAILLTVVLTKRMIKLCGW